MSRNPNYCFTWNNYNEQSIVYLANLECGYIAYSEEVAPTTGTPHLQGYIHWNNAVSHATAKRRLPGCYVAVMRGRFDQNETYCSKEATLIKRGTCPQFNVNNGANETQRWKDVRENAVSGRLDLIEDKIYIRYYGTLKRIRDDHRPKPLPSPVTCYWIYGKTRTGKSHAVETKYPDCYKKEMSDPKWFDNYEDEPVIYLEDIDKFNVKFGGCLKRLADKWPMQVQVKGSMRYIRPTKIIVTSNYKIEDIWDDSVTQECLNSRFIVIEKFRDQDIII